MTVKVFSAKYLDDLVLQATIAPRLRQHRNIHTDYADPCQRLFNAIDPDSYIRPHRHGLVPRYETMIAVRGLMLLFLFDDHGRVVETVPFGVDSVRHDVAVGVEISPRRWHTVIALYPGSVLLEVKAGPFDPEIPKEFAPWAPEESSEDAKSYMQELIAITKKINWCHKLFR